tara:strand:- start:1471 stop:2010 length:540 start_codon:yes stop_codon:yes gene_type:complete
MQPGKQLKLKKPESNLYKSSNQNFFDEYLKRYYGEENNKRMPYAGEDKIQDLLEFLKPQYTNQKELKIEDSKEFQMYRKSFGRPRHRHYDRYPETPASIESDYQWRKKNTKIAGDILIDNRENRLNRYKKDREAFEKFMKDFSTKAEIYSKMVGPDKDNTALRYFYQNEDIRDLFPDAK